MIDSLNKNEMTVHAFGHLAGYGATVICRSGTKCTLECRSTGCKNMDYICMNGAQCTLKPKLCRTEGHKIDTFKGVECPNIITDVPEVYQILKRKLYKIESDEVYKRYNHEIEKDEEQFLSLGWKNLDYDEPAEDEVNGKETELFGDVGILVDEVSGINMKELMLIIVGSIFVITLGWSWYKLKFRGNIYVQLK